MPRGIPFMAGTRCASAASASLSDELEGGHLTIGICMVGGIATDSTPQNNFNSRQFDALYALLLTLHAKFPNAEVCGHRDFPKVAKACPSFDVREWCKSRALKPDFSNVVSGVTTTAPKE